jgi:hypothetical protein
VRIWIRRKDQKAGKHYALHDWLGTDTACHAIQFQGMNLAHYDVAGKAYEGERICSKCQLAIAESRGRL